MFACSSLGAGAAGCAGELGCWRVAECRCCVCLRAWVLVPLQGAAVCTLDLRHVAMCTLELGCFWAWHGAWAGMYCLGPRLDLAWTSPGPRLEPPYPPAACMLVCLCAACLVQLACLCAACLLLLVLLLLVLLAAACAACACISFGVLKHL